MKEPEMIFSQFIFSDNFFDSIYDFNISEPDLFPVLLFTGYDIRNWFPEPESLFRSRNIAKLKTKGSLNNYPDFIKTLISVHQ